MDKHGEAHILQRNEGKRIIPTIEFADGSVLVEPSNAALATNLGLKMLAEHSHYDLIVVGGGLAGLTAALHAAREGIDTLVIERAALGGQAAATERLENMPGYAEGVEGAPFADQLRRQAARFGVKGLQAQDVSGLCSHDNDHCGGTADGSEYSARALLLASGSRLGHNGGRPVGFENRDPSLLETSVPRIFAAGDARAGSTKQVASATGEGATAALLIRANLKTAWRTLRPAPGHWLRVQSPRHVQPPSVMRPQGVPPTARCVPARAALSVRCTGLRATHISRAASTR